jgi:hypothetical protein
MLHEILLALLGHTGSIIIQQVLTLDDLNELSDSTPPIKFMVNPNLDFISQAERHQLNVLVDLGAMYK